MMNDRDRFQYAPISALLRLAIRGNMVDAHIITMVKEAKLLSMKQISVNQVSRSVYTYTVTIERRRPEIVRNMNADKLGKEDLQRLLDFFESL